MCDPKANYIYYILIEVRLASILLQIHVLLYRCYSMEYVLHPFLLILAHRKVMPSSYFVLFAIQLEAAIRGLYAKDYVRPDVDS